MMKYLYNPPGIIKKVFSDFNWTTINNEVLITFDDGPNPGSSEKILKILNEEKIKSLFLCVGNNISQNGSLVEEILSEGHEIGNHTYNHTQITKVGKSTFIDEIKKTTSIMCSKYNYKMEYFRPPHGKFNFGLNGILKELELKNVMWSLLTYDYKNDINIVKFSVRKYLNKNSIVVFHDSNKSKEIIESSIRFTLDETQRRGFKIGVPKECLK